jgi:hypothetical protein
LIVPLEPGIVAYATPPAVIANVMSASNEARRLIVLVVMGEEPPSFVDEARSSLAAWAERVWGIPSA